MSITYNVVCLTAGLDYIAVNKILDFAPGVTLQRVRVIILDDLGRPKVEGPETFQLLLRMPTAAMLGDPSVAVVTINDSISDGQCVEGNGLLVKLLCVFVHICACVHACVCVACMAYKPACFLKRSDFSAFLPERGSTRSRDVLIREVLNKR